MRAIDHQAVEVFGAKARVLQRLRGKIGDLLEVEQSRRGGVFFWLVLGGAYNRRMTFQTHVSLARRLVNQVFVVG